MSDLQTAPAPSAFRLDSLSAYSAYYSSGLASNATQPLTSVPNSADVGMGASATVTWVHNAERSGFSMTYTATYSGQVRYSSLDALNHMFSMTATRRLTPRCILSFNTAANVITADQLTLLPNEPSGVALVSPSLLLYGQRMLGTSAQLALTYDLSSRTSIAWRIGGTRYQRLTSDSAVVPDGLVSPLSQNTTAIAGLQIAHSLSPRTQVSLSLDASRAISGFLNTWNQRVSVSINRTLSRRWFVDIRGGGGYVMPSREAGNPTASLQYSPGGPSATIPRHKRSRLLVIAAWVTPMDWVQLQHSHFVQLDVGAAREPLVCESHRRSTAIRRRRLGKHPHMAGSYQRGENLEPPYCYYR